jgi:hypothetical protein
VTQGDNDLAHAREEGVELRKSVDLPCCRMAENWDWGYVTPLRVVYYRIWVAGTFPTPSHNGSGRTLFRQVKISCYATKGKRAGTEGPIWLSDAPGKRKREYGCCPELVPDRGFLSERGWRRRGMEMTEKEKWFNYARGWVLGDGKGGFELSG